MTIFTRSILVLLLGYILFSSAICNEKLNPKLSYSWIIGSEKTACQGVAVQECLWIKTDGIASEWELYYDQIEGFEYIGGYEYEITVSEETITNPPADASSLKHTLIEVISKEMKASEGLPD